MILVALRNKHKYSPQASHGGIGLDLCNSIEFFISELQCKLNLLRVANKNICEICVCFDILYSFFVLLTKKSTKIDEHSQHDVRH